MLAVEQDYVLGRRSRPADRERRTVKCPVSFRATKPSQHVGDRQRAPDTRMHSPPAQHLRAARLGELPLESSTPVETNRLVGSLDYFCFADHTGAGLWFRGR